MARRNNSSGFNGIIGIIITLVVVYVMFQVFQLAISALWFLGPLFLIIAFFLNRSVVFNFFKTIFTEFKTKPVMSVAKGLLSFFALPLVGGYLFGKAVVKNKVAEATGHMKKQQEQEQQYTEYEDVSEPTAEAVENDDFLDISDIEKQLDDLTVKETKAPPTTTPKAKRAKPDSNKYDNLFD